MMTITTSGVIAASIIACLVPWLITFGIITLYTWKVFTKAGKPGWYSLIPFYSGYTMYNISWRGTMYIASLVLRTIGILAMLLSTALMSGSAYVILSVILLLLSVIFTLASVGIEIGMCYHLCKAFGKGSGFLAGLILLRGIFMLILAFDRSVYIGKD